MLTSLLRNLWVPTAFSAAGLHSKDRMIKRDYSSNASLRSSRDTFIWVDPSNEATLPVFAKLVREAGAILPFLVPHPWWHPTHASSSGASVVLASTLVMGWLKTQWQKQNIWPSCKQEGREGGERFSPWTFSPQKNCAHHLQQVQDWDHGFCQRPPESACSSWLKCPLILLGWLDSGACLGSISTGILLLGS